MGKAVYPKSHEPGMRVPKGGSCCANCKFMIQSECVNDLYVSWRGDGVIPAPVDEYCSDWWEPRGSVTEIDIHEAFARTLARRK